MKDGGKQILYICKNSIITQFKAVLLFTYCILRLMWISDIDDGL